MVILKKIVIMTEHGKSNCSGIVKFENFAGRTSCFVRILGLKGDGVICIKCDEDTMYLGSLFDGEHKFNALYDLNKTIQIIVVADGSVVCMGSNKGRFSPNALMIDVHRYYARIPQMQVVETAAIEQKPVEESIVEQRIEEIEARVNAAPVMQESQQVEEQVVEPAVEENTYVRQADAEKSKQEKKVGRTKSAEPFYKKIEKNLNELFEAHEKDEELTLLIPESRWARVPIDGDGYYVVGVIESDGTPNLICYGVPDKDDSNPPKNSSDCRQWMEIEKGGRGYWMMYQSAVSGETLTTTII